SDPDIVTGGPTINDKYRETAPIGGIEERPSKAKAYAMSVQEKEAALQPMVAEAVLADEGMEEEVGNEAAELDEEELAYQQFLAEKAAASAAAAAPNPAPVRPAVQAAHEEPEFSFEV